MTSATLQARGTAASRSRGQTAAAASVLVVAALAMVTGALLPAWRTPLLVTASFACGAVIVAAVRRREPSPRWPWLVLAGMCALTGTAQAVALTPLAGGAWSVAVAALAQVGAAVVGVHVAFGPSRARQHRPGVLDAAVLVVTLGLVGAQLTLVATDRGAQSVTGVLTPSVDVAFLVVVVIYAVSRARVVPAVRLGITAASAYLVVDLATALQGHRLAPPGDPLQVVSLVVGPLFAASALVPSMTDVFDRTQLAMRRTPSSALVRLLPLIAVPPALWAVAHAADVRGLPDWVLVMAGAGISALCLVRAATALRSTEVMARHDTLTTLPNRHGLALALAAGHASPQGLVLVDVDDFKTVNDTHGHEVGDRALLAVRDRLLDAVGDRALVGRLGGDEFALLVAGESADEVARTVLAALRVPVHVQGLELRVPASAGVALPEDSSEPGAGVTSGDGAGALAELLTHADVAMYSAKAAGRDRAVVYRPQMRLEVAHRFTLSNELRLLLGGPDAAVGDLEVHYQVLVDLTSEEAVGSEALVRWRHPRLGLLPPGEFLELVTSSGLDAALDEAVLRETVDQIARWRSQGRLPPPVSVNLTRESLVRDDLVELVLSMLVDAGVPAALLHLEITEHEALPDDAAVAERLVELDAAGVRVHLDDYGTGYTSMDYLRRFPVRVLKIDRAVTSTLEEDAAVAAGAGTAPGAPHRGPVRGSIVGGLAAMADALGIDLLAEGVETREQADALRALGVRYAQGYLYGRPMPAVEHAVAARSAAGPLRPASDGCAGTGRASGPGGAVRTPPGTDLRLP